MHQSVDFSIEKLFAPIENLDLDRRAFHRLKRADIRTVSQIINLGEANLLSLRNLGPTLVDHVFLKVSNFLGISKERLFSEPIRKISKSQKGNVFDPLEASVLMLDLSPTTIKYLRKAGIVLIKDLITSRNNQYSNISHVGKKAIREIDKELRLYLNLNQFSENDKNESAGSLDENVSTIFHDPTKIVAPEEFRDVIDSKSLLTSRVDNLGTILGWLGVNERAWLAIDLRANQLLTLQEVSSRIGGLTRERARQIVLQVEEKVDREIRSFGIFFDYFEAIAIKVRQRLIENNIENSILVNELRMNLADSNLVATDKEWEKLIAIIRMLFLHRKPGISDMVEKKWKTMVFLCCLVDPAIEKNKDVSKYLKKQKNKRKQLSYKELAHLILSQTQRPLHWSEIANQAYKLGRRRTFETRALYHALLAHEDTFVRTAQGTYALAEWGTKRVKPYPDIIASVLKKENQAIPLDLILAKVSSLRPIKQPSLIMYLEMHPRFYKSINNTYGLRGWLPPRERQNLRTPEWLIEISKSFERVERAKQKGYDIESIIADDTLR